MNLGQEVERDYLLRTSKKEAVLLLIWQRS